MAKTVLRGVVRTSLSPSLQVKIIRLVRLTKLLRIFRVSKFLAAIESSVSINYSYLQLAQHIAVIVLATHWTACSCLLFTRVEVRALPTPPRCSSQAHGAQFAAHGSSPRLRASKHRAGVGSGRPSLGAAARGRHV